MSDRESLDDQPQSKRYQTKRYHLLSSSLLAVFAIAGSESRRMDENGARQVRGVRFAPPISLALFSVSVLGASCWHVKLARERANAHLGVSRTTEPPSRSVSRLREERGRPCSGRGDRNDSSTSACMHDHRLSRLCGRFC